MGIEKQDVGVLLRRPIRPPRASTIAVSGRLHLYDLELAC